MQSKIRSEIKSIRKSLMGKAGATGLARDWVGHFNDMDSIIVRLDPNTHISTPEQKRDLARQVASTGLSVKAFLSRMAPKIIRDLNNSVTDRDI